MGILIIWIINAVALLAVGYLLPGVTIDGFGSALIAALVLGFINSIIRPIFIILTIPLTIVTLGLFLVVINALLFWLAGSIFSGFSVNSFWWALFGALIYSIISSFFIGLLSKGNHE